MNRDTRKRLVLLDCLFSAVQSLGGEHQHLLIHEAMGRLYAYYRKHPNCGYYDFESPWRTEALFIELLKLPLGVCLVPDIFSDMEAHFDNLRRLQREAVAEMNRIPPLPGVAV